MKNNYDTVLFEIAGPIARITLNRPQAMNAFTPTMVAELHEIADRIADDGTLRIVSITGSGRAFSTGIDLKAFESGEIDMSYMEPWERLLRRFETMDKIVLCLLHGYFIGGLQLALACDIRVATPAAKGGVPAAKEGLIAGMAPWRLARFVGFGRAKKIALYGHLITGEEAHDIGLVDHLVSEDDMAVEYEALVQEYLAGCSEGCRNSKLAMAHIMAQDFESYLTNYLSLQKKTFGGPDLKEALAAHVEGRRPVWA